LRSVDQAIDGVCDLVFGYGTGTQREINQMGLHGGFPRKESCWSAHDCTYLVRHSLLRGEERLDSDIRPSSSVASYKERL
jgi:hypothetical protein